MLSLGRRSQDWLAAMLIMSRRSLAPQSRSRLRPGILSLLSNIEQIFRRNGCSIIWLNDVNLQNCKLPRMEFDLSPFGLYLEAIAGDLAARPEDCACSRSLASKTT
jgi:hypothetical protein